MITLVRNIICVTDQFQSFKEINLETILEISDWWPWMCYLGKLFVYVMLKDQIGLDFFACSGLRRM